MTDSDVVSNTTEAARRITVALAVLCDAAQEAAFSDDLRVMSVVQGMFAITLRQIQRTVDFVAECAATAREQQRCEEPTG